MFNLCCAFGTVFDSLLNKKHRPIQSGDQKRGNGGNDSKHRVDHFLDGGVILDFLDGFHGVFSFVFMFFNTPHRRAWLRGFRR